MVRENDRDNRSQQGNENLGGISSSNESSRLNTGSEEEISDAENLDLEDDELDEDDFEVDEEVDDSEDE